MTKNPVCVKPTDLVTKARSIIRKHGYRALLVVDDKKLVGIISRGDVLKVTSTKTNITVKGLMSTNIISVSADDDLIAAAKLIVEYHIRQLPVVDGNIVGIISSLDILLNLVETKHMPSKKDVKTIMSRNVVTCKPDDELASIWSKMLETGFSGLPVIEKNHVVGMVTRMDILKHGSARLSKESGRAKTIQVKKIMKAPAIVCSINSTAKEAAETMVAKHILRLPVVDEKNKIAGIIDIEDVLRAFVP